MPGRERLQAQHPQSAARQLIQRRTAHRAQPDHDDVVHRELQYRFAQHVLNSFAQRNEIKLASVLPRADAPLAAVWWLVLVLRGILPAVFAMAMLVGAIQQQTPLAGPLTLVGVTFVLLQVLTPIHTAVSTNLGDRTAAW